MRMGIEIATILKRMYPEKFDGTKTVTLLGNAAAVQQLQDGVAPEKIVAGWNGEVAVFEGMRRKYILYK